MGKRRTRRPSRRVKLYVEGETEEASVRSILRGYLGRRGLDIRNTKGVGNFFRKIGKFVKNSVEEGAAEVFGLLDLHNALPGGEEREKEGMIRSLRERVLESIPEDLRDRFRLFIAVREYEAWALADHESLAGFVGGRAGPWPNPEDVNAQKPPKKVIGRLMIKYRKRKYRPVLHGKRLFETLRPAIVRNGCPHFDELASALEE